MKKLVAVMLAAVLCMSVLTACGGEKASEALADGVLNVGTNAEFPPFEYVNDNGEPDGFDIALIKAVGEKLGVTVQVDNMEFAWFLPSERKSMFPSRE